MRRLATTLALLAVVALLPSCGDPRAPKAGVIRVGHFPNVTHAQGVLGHAGTRAGKGWFEERLPAGTRVEWQTFSAGPTAMLSLLAGALDLCYVGPSPALNAHLRSGGSDVRVVSGAARGGSGLVVRKGGPVRRAADFRGRRVATPQLGNTQDVAARTWLAAGGLRVAETGGDVTILPSQNPAQLGLFQRGDVDGVWTVEPWVSRLELEAGGHLLVEEPDTLTTVLVASARFFAERRDDVKRFVEAHRALTEWVAAHPAEAKARFQEELREETGGAIRPDVLERAWPRLRWSAELRGEDFPGFAAAARSVGLLPEGPIDRLVEAP